MENVDILKSKIGESSFIVEFLHENLLEKDEIYKEKYGNKIIKNFSTKEISEGKGFLSHVYRCTFTFTDSVDEYSVILKIPTRQCLDDAQNKANNFEYNLNDDFFTRCHQFECDFYDNIAPILNIKVPKVFKTLPWIMDKHEGCILMEDLSGKGQCKNISETLNIPQIKQITEQLAKMHAKLLTCDQKLWKGKFMGHQEIFSELAKDAKMCFKNLVKLIKDDGFEKLYHKYAKIAANPEFLNYIVTQSHIDLGIHPIFCHGDLWTSNIMWKTDKNGRTTDELLAIIDWQILMEGSPMMDLARVLAICTQKKIRNEAEKIMIDYYLEVLKNEITNGFTVPYTKKQLQDCYNYGILMQTFGFLVSAFFFIEGIDNADNEKNKKIHAIADLCKGLVEDSDILLSGELKHLYEKFGQ